MREILQAGKHHTMTQHKSPKLSQVARGAWNLPWIQQPIPGARHFCYGLKMLWVAVARLSSILRFTPCSQRSPLEAHTSALSSCGRSTCWWKACKGRRARKLRIFFCPSSRVLVFAVNLFYWLDAARSDVLFSSFSLRCQAVQVLHTTRAAGLRPTVGIWAFHALSRFD